MELANKVKIWTPSDMQETCSDQTDLVISNFRRTLLKGAALAVAGPALWTAGTAHAMPDHIIVIDNEGPHIQTPPALFQINQLQFRDIMVAAMGDAIHYMRTRYRDRYPDFDWNVVGRDAIGRAAGIQFAQLYFALGRDGKTVEMSRLAAWMVANIAVVFAATVAQELLQWELRKRGCSEQGGKWMSFALTYVALGIWQWFFLNPVMSRVATVANSPPPAPSVKNELRRRRLAFIGKRGTEYGLMHLGAFLNPKQLTYKRVQNDGWDIETATLKINVDADPNMGNEVWKYCRPLSQMNLSVTVNPNTVDLTKKGKVMVYTTCNEDPRLPFASCTPGQKMSGELITIDPKTISSPF